IMAGVQDMVQKKVPFLSGLSQLIGSTIYLASEFFMAQIHKEKKDQVLNIECVDKQGVKLEDKALFSALAQTLVESGRLEAGNVARNQSVVSSVASELAKAAGIADKSQDVLVERLVAAMPQEYREAALAG